MAAVESDDTWLKDQINAFGLDTEVYEGYIEGIMSDEDTELDERIESVLAFLGSATEEDLTSFGEGLKDMWNRRLSRVQETVDTEKIEGLTAFMQRLEADKEAAQKEQERQAEEALQRQQDRAEARGREALLNKYGFDVDAVDEEGNLVGSAEYVSADSTLGSMMGSNSNKTQVQEAMRQQREKAKKEHMQKVLREKELLLKDKLKKEKEKQRTQKKEKQRGRG